MKIFFIRHGETTGDVENRYGGNYDDHLSSLGIEQSKALAETLKDAGIEIIYSSSLLRAQETSQILSQKIRCSIQMEPNFKERNQYGVLSGMVKEDARRQYPEYVELLKDRLNTIEGAESYVDFRERIAEAFSKVMSLSENKVVAVVSHGGPFRVLFRDILQWGELKEIGDCAYVELEYNGDTFHWMRAERLTPSFQTPVP